MKGTPTRGFSMWLLGLLGWVPRTSIHPEKKGRREQRRKGIRARGCVAFYDPASEVTQYHFCHILFIRSESLRLAHIHREGNLTLPLSGRYVRVLGGHVLKPSHMTSQAPPLKILIWCVWDGTQEFVFNRYPSGFYFQGSLESIGSGRDGLVNAKLWTWT